METKKIEEQLNNLPFLEVPSEVHQSTMRKIDYSRFKPILFTAFILLVINFIIIAWHIDSKLVEAEFSDMVQDFFQGFEMNFSFIDTILRNFFEIISPAVFFSGFLSLMGVAYLGNKIIKLQYML